MADQPPGKWYTDEFCAGHDHQDISEIRACMTAKLAELLLQPKGSPTTVA